MKLFRNLCYKIVFKTTFADYLKEVIEKEYISNRNSGNNVDYSKYIKNINTIREKVGKGGSTIPGDQIDLNIDSYNYKDESIREVFDVVLQHLRRNILYFHNVDMYEEEIKPFFNLKPQMPSFRVSEEELKNYLDRTIPKVKRPLKNGELYSLEFVKRNFLNFFLDPVLVALNGTPLDLSGYDFKKGKEFLLRLCAICSNIEKDKTIWQKLMNIKAKYEILFLLDLDEKEYKVHGKDINDFIEFILTVIE